MQKTLPKKEKDRRAKVMVVIIAIAFLACVGNLFRIQVVQADYYKGKAEENQLYDTEIPAQRGTIYDSEGNVLAQSASVWLVYIDPYSVPDDSVRADLCSDLSNALGINGDTLMKKLKMTKYRYLVIAKQVEYDNKEKVIEIKKKKYEYTQDGKKQYAYGSAMVGIDPDVKRYYPNGNLASHIIGYTNSEGNGQAGIELYYNSILSGIPGRKVTAKDAYGRAMPLQYETLYDATNGQKLQLTVNSNIQREHVLPSEKAFAYKMRMEAMKHQGKATSSQLGTKLRTLDAMGKEVDESRNQIHRYIRLTYLIPSILQMVDDGRIAFNPAVEISYMTGEHQTWLKEEMDMCDATPSLVQSRTLKDMSRNGTLTENYLHTLLTEEKPNQRQKFFLNQSDVQQYFPSNYTPQQMQNVIISLLRNWEHKRSSRQRPQREDELER